MVLGKICGVCLWRVNECEWGDENDEANVANSYQDERYIGVLFLVLQFFSRVK